MLTKRIAAVVGVAVLGTTLIGCPQKSHIDMNAVSRVEAAANKAEAAASKAEMAAKSAADAAARAEAAASRAGSRAERNMRK